MDTEPKAHAELKVKLTIQAPGEASTLAFPDMLRLIADQLEEGYDTMIYKKNGISINFTLNEPRS